MARISLYDIWKYENPDVQEIEIDFYDEQQEEMLQEELVVQH